MNWALSVYRILVFKFWCVIGHVQNYFHHSKSSSNAGCTLSQSVFGEILEQELYETRLYEYDFLTRSESKARVYIQEQE